MGGYPLKAVRTIMLAVCMSALVASCAAASEIGKGVSLELEYAGGIIKTGIADGDINKLAEAHRILSNLELTLNEVKSAKERTTFTLALGFNYADMCPSVYLMQLSKPGNQTGFKINCAEKSVEYLKKAVDFAGSKLAGSGAGDACYIAGVGADRLKSNMSSVPGADTEKYFDLASEYFKCAAKKGSSYTGINTILGRLEHSEYLKEPVVDDAKYYEIERSLFLGSVSYAGGKPQEKTTQIKVEREPDKVPPVAQNRPVDENTYLNYQWRFSVKRPDDSWKFVVSNVGQSFYLSIVKKNSANQKGSGLSIMCSNMKDDDEYALDKLVDRSASLLEQAGYTVKGKTKSTLFSLPSYDLKSEHRYNELVPSDSRMEPGVDIEQGAAVVSIQNMKITTLNGIQYIISFSSLASDSAEAEKVYSEIIKTIEIF